MVLYLDSDTSYLSMPKARSRVGGHFYLSTHPHHSTKIPTQLSFLIGPIHTVCIKLRNVISSAAEVEAGELFMSCHKAMPICTIFQEMGHPQPPTPVKTNNFTAFSIVNSTMKQWKTRAMDMWFYWVWDQMQQGQFLVYWAPSIGNLADFFTKIHRAAHHWLHWTKYAHQAITSPTPTSTIMAITL